VYMKEFLDFYCSPDTVSVEIERLGECSSRA
jgi:hypothetical protein